jgi:streptogramin lyase
MLGCCLDDGYLRLFFIWTKHFDQQTCRWVTSPGPSKTALPPDVACLAQTNDGFLWLCGGPNGLVRFDGTRFEPSSSPYGDQLLSTNLYSLFVLPSGGLWVGYRYDGFSFLDKGRVTNYASETGSVYGFAQDRDGIVWAGASSGLWRFDHSSWQHVGVEWDVAAGAVRQVGFDSQGILWALVGSAGAPKDLIYLMPGIGRFKTATRNLSVEEFTRDADQSVLTEPAASPMSDRGKGSDERPPVYPVRTRNLQFVDRNNSLWTLPEAGMAMVVQGVLALLVGPPLGAVLFHMLSIALGLLLLAGLWTPVAAEEAVVIISCSPG